MLSTNEESSTQKTVLSSSLSIARSIARRGLNIILWIGAVLLLLMMIFCGFLRWQAPAIDTWRPQVVSFIQYLGLPIEIGKIELEAEGTQWQLILHDTVAVVQAGPEVKVKIDQLVVQFTWTAWFNAMSLWDIQAKQVDFTITLRQPSLNWRERVNALLQILPKFEQISIQQASVRLYHHQRLLMAWYDLSAKLTLDQIGNQTLEIGQNYHDKTYLHLRWQQKSLPIEWQYHFSDLEVPLASDQALPLTGYVQGIWLNDLKALTAYLTWRLPEPYQMPKNKAAAIFPAPIRQIELQLTQVASGYQILLEQPLGYLKGLYTTHKQQIQAQNFSLEPFDLQLLHHFWPITRLVRSIELEHLQFIRSTEDEPKYSGTIRQLVLASPEHPTALFTQPLSMVFEQEEGRGRLSLLDNINQAQETGIAISGKLSWQQQKSHIHIVPAIHLQHPAISVSAQGELLGQWVDQKWQIKTDLEGDIAVVKWAETLSIISQFLPARARTWLQASALEANIAQAATWVLRTDGFVWADQWLDVFKAPNHLMHITLPFTKLTVLPFKTYFPLLKAFEGEAVIDPRGLKLLANSGEWQNVTLNNIQLALPFSAPVNLSVQGQTVGDAAAYWQFLSSLTHYPIGRFAWHEWIAKGKVTTEVVLELPLSKQKMADYQLSIVAFLENVALKHPQSQMEIQQIHGTLPLNRYGIAGTTDLKLKWYEQPLVLKLSQTDRKLTAQVKANLAIGDVLTRYWPKSQIGLMIQGIAAVEAQFSIVLGTSVKDKWQLVVNSNLVGVEIAAPFGLDKTKAQASPINLQIKGAALDKWQMQLQYGKILELTIHNAKRSTKKIIDALPTVKLLLHTKDVEGELTLKNGKWEGHLKRLVVPDHWAFKLGASKNNHLMDKLESLLQDLSAYLHYWSILPLGQIQIENVYRGNQLLGNIQMKSNLGADYWALETTINTQEKLNWQTRLQLMPQQVSLQSQLDTSDLLVLADWLAMPPSLIGQAYIDARFIYSSKPMTTAESQITGDAYITVSKGQIRAIEGSLILRLLGLINLDALSRRLRLDFSDVYSQGLPFDEIVLPIEFAARQLQIHEGRLISPALKTTITGSIDLSAQRYDITLMIVPAASATLPIAGAIAGGPLVGVGLLIAERLVGDQINQQVAQIKHQLRGEW